MTPNFSLLAQLNTSPRNRAPQTQFGWLLFHTQHLRLDVLPRVVDDINMGQVPHLLASLSHGSLSTHKSVVLRLGLTAPRLKQQHHPLVSVPQRAFWLG